MPSSLTSPPRSRSSISLALLVAVVALAPACDDDETCGVGSAPASGLVASATGVTLTYGDLSSLSGNDCPDPAAPSGVVSLSIEGRTADGTGLVTFCIPRPDQLGSGARALGNTPTMADVRVIDLTGMAAGCSYDFESTLPAPTGTVTASGVCANGTDPAGFALTIDGTVTVTRTCGATVDSVALTLAGTVAVTSRD